METLAHCIIVEDLHTLGANINNKLSGRRIKPDTDKICYEVHVNGTSKYAIVKLEELEQFKKTLNIELNPELYVEFQGPMDTNDFIRDTLDLLDRCDDALAEAKSIRASDEQYSDPSEDWTREKLTELEDPNDYFRYYI